MNRYSDLSNLVKSEENHFYHTLDALPPKPLEEYLSTQVNVREQEAEIFLQIEGLVEKFLKLREVPVNAHQLELMRSSYHVEDIVEVLRLILAEQLTMGLKVSQFEKAWSAWLGAPDSLMVNSGSSANLLALAAFASAGLKPGDEVVVPAVCWSTSVFPVVQYGLVPVFVDINPETLNIDPLQIEAAITPKTRALVVVHVLGNPCEMDRILEIARAHRLLVLEDCCEAHGAAIKGQRVGTFGDLGTFSFFFSHHMTTIEGGMVCMRQPEAWYDTLTSLRAHGWIRGRRDEEELASRHPEFDRRWLFVTPGYNLRPTEINAVLGLSQLKKLDRFLHNRCRIRDFLATRLAPYQELLRTQRELPDHRHSGFGIALVVQPGAPFTRQQLQAYLEEHRIQTRPLIAGNMVRQPVMRHLPHRVAPPSGELVNADRVHLHGIMIGNHHNVTFSQQEYVADTIENFLTR